MTGVIVERTRHMIGDGRAGGIDTLHRMRAIILDQIAAPIVRLTAARIVTGTGTNSDYQIELLRRWLRLHIGFLRDPLGEELLQTPADVLAMLAANGSVDVDCDDVAMLGAALGMSIGLRARLQMIGVAGGYTHVWTELSTPDGDPRWIDLDITRPYQVDVSRYPLSLTVEV